MFASFCLIDIKMAHFFISQRAMKVFCCAKTIDKATENLQIVVAGDVRIAAVFTLRVCKVG
jgi:hypothetical protein